MLKNELTTGIFLIQPLIILLSLSRFCLSLGCSEQRLTG